MLKYLDLPGGSMSGKVVSFKINEEKYAILKKEADEKGLSVGQYVRQKILEEEKDDDEREFTNLEFNLKNEEITQKLIQAKDEQISSLNKQVDTLQDQLSSAMKSVTKLADQQQQLTLSLQESLFKIEKAPLKDDYMAETSENASESSSVKTENETKSFWSRFWRK